MSDLKINKYFCKVALNSRQISIEFLGFIVAAKYKPILINTVRYQNLIEKV